MQSSVIYCQCHIIQCQFPIASVRKKCLCVNEINVHLEPQIINAEVIQIILVCKRLATSAWLIKDTSIKWVLYLYTLNQDLDPQSAGNETEAMFAIDVAFFVLLVIEFMSSWFADVAALGPEPDERTGEKEPLLPGKHIDNDRQEV